MLGRHLLIEMTECAGAIGDRTTVETALRAAVSVGGATLLDLVSHQFLPSGATALALLAESHLAIHTWPEKNMVAADLFTCGARVNAQAAIAVLEEYFLPGQTDVREVARGLNEEVTPLSEDLA